MKKLFYAIIAVVAAFGFAACEKEGTELAGNGLTFYATIEGSDTRISMSQSGDIWNSAWEGDESLTITSNYENYFVFTNTAAEPNKFSCNMAGVEALKSAEKLYVFNSQALNSVNSAIGADGMFLYAETAWAENITLIPSAAMLHFDSEYYVTFAANDMFGDGNHGRLSEITVAAGESVFVPIFAGNTTLSYSIGGTVCGTMELDVKAGVVYELGTLVPGQKPQQSSTIYFVPGNVGWGSDDAWFAAYFFSTSAGDANAKMTDSDGDGIFECAVPEGMTNVIFCRMNPAYPEFGWNVEGETVLHVWNQTVDLEISAAPNNYFYLTSWDNGEWHGAGYEFPVVASAWSISGEMNGWGDTPLVSTSTANLFVAKGVTTTADYTPFKVRKDGKWDVNYGGAFSYFESNKFMSVWAQGQDMHIITAGTYDIYFQYISDNEGKVYLVTAGADHTTAVEQTAEGQAPALSTVSFGLVGEHNSWSAPDDKMTFDSSTNTYVKTNVPLAGAFKIRGNESWGAYNYGAEGSGTVTVGKSIKVKNGSNTNLTVAAGTYDVYFSYDKNLVWVMTPGQVPADL